MVVIVAEALRYRDIDRKFAITSTILGLYIGKFGLQTFDLGDGVSYSVEDVVKKIDSNKGE